MNSPRCAPPSDDNKQQQAVTSPMERDMRSSFHKSAPVKPRAVLTKTEVIAIFQIKGTQSATKIARCFGVSEKAIRDIWTARTWAAETWHLDTSRLLNIKSSGRPLGCRDSKPRKHRQASKGCRGIPSPTGRESFWEPILGVDACIVGQQISARSDLSTCDLPSHLSLACTDIPPCDQIIYSEATRRSGHSRSLDEQLLDWEHGLVRHLPDPFEADWSAAALLF